MKQEVIELDGVDIDLQENLETEVNKYGGFKTKPNQWASEYALEAPIFHVSGLNGIRDWAQSDSMSLLSHRALHGLNTISQAPENTEGHTCAEDVKRGLDTFIFASLGMLALADKTSFGAVVLKPEVLQKGYMSLHELGRFDNILLSPAERFGDHDEAEVLKANQEAFEQYVRTIVPGSQFHEVFSRYLSRNFNSVNSFLSSHDFVPGERDIPPRGSVAYDELMAKKALVISYGQPAPMESLEGYSYRGPQLIVPGKVEKELVKGVIIFSDERLGNSARSTAKLLQEVGLPVITLTRRDLQEHLSKVEDKVFKRGGREFRLRATLRAAYNLSFSSAAAKLDELV